ncbi:MAG: rod shape-determining protein MreC [Bacteroidales bacterium]|nr:rod shape-determining protein MreC [Bacteroidales bacterium]
MRNLLAFISRYEFFFLFLIFLVISFILIYNNNYYQRSRVIGTTNRVTGKLNLIYANITGYLDLKNSNEMLAAENARLRTTLGNMETETTDSLYLPEASSLNYMSARVISNSVQQRNNYFMLDKGWRDGVRKDMGVITADGIVGIIIDVSGNFSSGISVLHKDARISGKIKKNNQLVNISWDGMNYRLGTIAHIPAHVHLLQGDTVITSGNSQIFPEGIPIGTIEYIEDEMETLFKQGKIRYSLDYNRLNYVYIVNNPLLNEFRTLTTEIHD